MDKQDILERLDFYREAPVEVQSTISTAARYLRLAPGDFLFREGDAPREFAAVGAGSIRVFRIGVGIAPKREPPPAMPPPPKPGAPSTSPGADRDRDADDEPAVGPGDPGVAEKHEQDRDPAETFQVRAERRITSAWRHGHVSRLPERPG